MFNRKEYEKQWRKDNAEHLKEYKKQWGKDNAEHIKDCKKKWYKENAERIKKRRKQRYLENPGKQKEAIKQWRKNNPEKVKEYSKRCRENHREERKEYNKQYGKNHLKEIKQHRKEKVQYVQDYKLSKGCKFCGYNKNPRLLGFHHPDNDKEYNVSYTTKHMSLEKIKKEMDKCIVLCVSCHSKLRRKLKKLDKNKKKV